MEQRNLIVPLVGDFAGPKALRSVARYLDLHHATVSVFYTSNVEQYLFRGDLWQRFYSNVGALPIDARSTFVRAYFNNQGRVFRFEPGQRNAGRATLRAAPESDPRAARGIQRRPHQQLLRRHRPVAPVTTRAIAAIALATGLLAQGQTPTFKSRADLVEVDVIVVDKDGAPVRGLPRSDFALQDRGKPQDVATFDEMSHDRRAQASAAPPAGVPRDVSSNQTAQSGRLVVMVVDDLHIYRERTDRAKDIARKVLADLGPQSSMAVLFTSGEHSTLPQHRSPGARRRDRHDARAASRGAGRIRPSTSSRRHGSIPEWIRGAMLAIINEVPVDQACRTSSTT